MEHGGDRGVSVESGCGGGPQLLEVIRGQFGGREVFGGEEGEAGATLGGH